MNQCPLCDRVSRCGRGEDAWHIATLDECVVVLGDNQGCRGWCVLLLREHVEHLDELTVERQRRVFGEVARVAHAIREVFPGSGKMVGHMPGPPRINYECLGNQVAHVHWHVIPRHADDPTPTRAVWDWPEEQLRGTLTELKKVEILKRLRARLG